MDENSSSRPPPPPIESADSEGSLGSIDAPIPPISDSIPLTDSEAAHRIYEKGYIVRKQFSGGSYGTVHRAESWKCPEREIVCKIIDISHHSEMYRNVHLPREVKFLRTIKHPNIIQVFDILGPYSEKLYIFMEYAGGEDFLEFILRHGPLRECDAKGWFLQMAKGLNYCHSIGIAHRDIKCENVLMDEHGTVKWTDFGYARPVLSLGETIEKGARQVNSLEDLPRSSKGKIVVSHTWLGSPGYKAPEIMKKEPYHPLNADIWSLGVTFFVLSTSRFPFPDEEKYPKIILECALKKKFKLPDSLGFSQEYKDLINGLLEPIVSHRLDMPELIGHAWFLKDPYFFHA